MKNLSLTQKMFVSFMHINFDLRINRQALLLIFFITLPWISYAQYDHIAFRHLNIDNGLSNNTVWTIYKDSRGFMWFGTTDGLNCFDGHSFTVFKNDPQSDNSISDSNITSVFEDSKGRIWTGTSRGLSLFDRNTQTFFTFKDTVNGIDLARILVYKVIEDDKGIIWVTGSNGFFKFNMEEGKIVNYKADENDPNSIAQNWSAGIHIEDENKIWIGHNGLGLSEFNIKEEKFLNYKFEDSQLSGARLQGYNVVREILPYGEGNLLLGTFGGLLSFNKKTGLFRRIVIDGHQFLATNAIVRDKNPDQVWISTAGEGLFLIDLRTERLDKWTHNRENLLGLSENSLMGMLLDDQGLLWIGTARKGINILDTKNPFKIYQSSNSWLSSHLISSIFEDSRGSLWIGTSGSGLNVISDRIRHDQFINTEFGRFFSKSYVTCIEEDDKNNIWIGTSGGGIFKYNIYTGNYKRFTNDPEDSTSLSHNVIECIKKDKNGKLWIGTYWGYSVPDAQTEKFQHGGIERIYSILPDKHGVWFGYAFYGLVYKDLEENRITNYVYNKNDSSSISNNAIQTIFMDRDSIIWIGTKQGLNRFNRNAKNFTRFTTKDGLCDNAIMGILEDNSGNLWISTNKGLSKYEKKTSSFNNYYSEDGLQSNQFSRQACYKNKNGTLYFGGINGLTVFDPEKVLPRKRVPQVAITGFYLFNQQVPLRSDPPGEYSYQFFLDKPVHLTESIHLKYFDKIFSLDFSALDYVNPQKNQYAFMLEGLEDQWNYTTSDKRFTTYTNLDPGKYVFKVKATNSDGIWNDTPTILSIKVDPPPWKTWWAYTAYGLIILGIIYTYNRSYQKRLIRKQNELEKERLLNEKLNKADKLKDEFLANTSHELRTPLTGIIGITESLQDGVAGKPSEEMKSNLSLIISSAKRLSSLVNSILDFSKLKTHELELALKPIDLRTVTDVVFQISQPLIKGKPVTLVNDIDPTISLVEADEERIYQIMHNLTGNAIKFTSEGTIQVSAVEKQDVVQVCVKDTGIGIPEDKIEDIFKSFEQVDASITREHGGTGLGLTITKQLVELHGGNIWIESEIDQGTRVYFSLPKSADVKSTIRDQQVLSKVVESGGVDVQEEKRNVEEKIRPIDSRFNILIVDDEPINQQVLSNHLSRDNFRILQAMNGQEALERLDREKLDLVLLDIMMPKMSGYEVCREIRKRYLPSELPVIMITAKNQIMDLVEGLASGANDYLAKPFSKDELLARLKTHLNLYNINAAYLRFIPKEFIRALGHENIIDVKLGDHVQDEMTILFSDIRSFTTITENLSVEDSFELLNEYLKHISPAISNNNGFIDKYIGDAVMALFHRKAEDAVKAAIEAQRNLSVYNEERKTSRKEKIHLGIGIHTGQLMMGTIGVKDRMDGTVISDAVNLASRLEELNKHYGTTLIVSEETIGKIENLEKYNYRFLSHVLVKGKENPIRIYEIFDGEADHIKSMKLKTLSLFNEGIKEYYNRRFTQASVKFQQVLDLFPEDRTTQIFLEQSAKYMVKGVPDDWDGVDVVENVL